MRLGVSTPTTEIISSGVRYQELVDSTMYVFGNSTNKDVSPKKQRKDNKVTIRLHKNTIELVRESSW